MLTVLLQTVNSICTDRLSTMYTVYTTGHALSISSNNFGVAFPFYTIDRCVFYAKTDMGHCWAVQKHAEKI